MKDKKYYKEKFKDYPDVVTLQEFREMLDGISYNKARQLVRTNKIKCFNIRGAYMIPKKCLSEYVVGEHDDEYKYSINVQI